MPSLDELVLQLGQEESSCWMCIALLPKFSHVLSKQSLTSTVNAAAGPAPSSLKSHLCHTLTATGTGNRQWKREGDTNSLVGLGFLGWRGEAGEVEGSGCCISQQFTKDKRTNLPFQQKVSLPGAVGWNWMT